ncbi:hypothetical protein BEP19_07530 [Ammoniphilus oxalaticus]|uniref:Flagellar protein FliL n=1 Tax=Ammoniphilus oxalaticus TaxID=66863 RepID=A0A419SJX9_9BACL|nr:flagellar basal body-associated FliL family protein [Ammoniphilus oxalaticus]RKD24246.1 hypothetical protein BEP19_07530 [Ammoniphilus oxalaticus]
MRRFLLMIISLILLLTVSGVTIWQVFKQPNDPAMSANLNADKLEENSMETDELTVNLAEHGYILLKFQLQADSVKTKRELELRMPQIRHHIIRIASVKTLVELKGEQGIENLEETLRAELNELVNTGQVIKVYTTKIIARD